MSDRDEIAQRHGIRELADQLHGETREELEAFAAAVAALRHRDEPPVNQGELAALAQVEAKDQRTRRLLGIPEPEVEDQ